MLPEMIALGELSRIAMVPAWPSWRSGAQNPCNVDLKVDISLIHLEIRIANLELRARGRAPRFINWGSRPCARVWTAAIRHIAISAVEAAPRFIRVVRQGCGGLGLEAQR